jgi:bifunctional DNase/RNase
MVRLAWVSVLALFPACAGKAAATCPEPVAPAPVEKTSGVTATRAYEASVPAANMVPMEVVDVLAVDGGAAVLLREPAKNGRVVPIFIGTSEGTAIALRLEGQQFTRPLTHDLLESIMKAHGLKVGRVEIHDLVDGTFHGRVVVLGPEGGVKTFDARASDSIAVALGSRADVFMADHVLNEAGASPESLGLQPDGTVPRADPGEGGRPPTRSESAPDPG